MQPLYPFPRDLEAMAFVMDFLGAANADVANAANIAEQLDVDAEYVPKLIEKWRATWAPVLLGNADRHGDIEWYGAFLIYTCHSIIRNSQNHPDRKSSTPAALEAQRMIDDLRGQTPPRRKSDARGREPER